MIKKTEAAEPIDANLVIGALREQVSELMFENTILKLMMQTREAAAGVADQGSAAS